MSKSGATINLNGIGMTFANRDLLLQEMVMIDGKTALAQDDVGMAQFLRQQMGEDSAVMYRRYLDLNGDGDGDEDELYLRMENDDWLNAVAEGGANGVTVQYHNEPVITQNNAPLFVQKNADLLQKAHARGQRVGFGVFAVGNPHESLIHSGAFDEMLLAAGENDALTLHEYFWKHPLDPSERGFLCFRVEDWLQRRAELIQQGKIVRFHRIVIAEYGRDKGGGINDGWRGQGWSAEHYLSLLLAGMAEYERLARLYGVEIYVNVFCAGSGFGQRWQSFNVEGETAIYRGLQKWNEEHPMTQNQTPDLAPLHDASVIEAAAGGTNIRTGASIGAPIVGKLNVGNVIQISEKRFFNDGFWWHQLSNGYVADTASFDWEPKTPPPPDNPIPQPPDGLYIPFSQDEIQQLANLHTNIAEQHRTIAAIYQSKVTTGQGDG